MVVGAVGRRPEVDGRSVSVTTAIPGVVLLCKGAGPGGQVVVDTVSLLSEAVKLDEVCRCAGVAYVRGEIRGVFGSVFCDFGDAFTVLDPDGEPSECVPLQSTAVAAAGHDLRACDCP